MKAADVMTRCVITVQEDSSVEQAAQLMLHHHISGVPVQQADGMVIGMLTERDLLRRGETGTVRQRPRWLDFILGPGRLAEEYVHTHSRKVVEVMTHKVYSVAPDASLESVVELMEQHQIKRVPVLQDDRLVGIISRANLLQTLATPASPASNRITDEQIRQRLLKELESSDWAPCALLKIQVRDGVVDLCGTITDERQRAALRVAAECICGVRAVHDHLVWLDALTGAVIDIPKDDTAPPTDEPGAQQPAPR
ncbi:CBS domain-containing protein [Neisseriaceae bacterium JH1-16]|nr:CBS domain-containing protein [Neisseriaceae bacterium JH1-16]